MRRRRRLDPFDRRSMLLSASAHALILVVGWLATRYQPEEMVFLTYEIDLVSPPPARQAEEPEPATEELVVERPDPEPTPPEPQVEEIAPIQAPDPTPDPPPEERTDPVEEVAPEVADAVVVAAALDPVEEEPEESGENLNVRIAGLKRDYPVYYENIIRQIHRCFRWTEGGNLETSVFFYIRRDGTAEGVDFVSRSGNTTFDYKALEAVECAGAGRFGALPDDLPFARFPILFTFSPSGDPTPFSPDAGSPGEAVFER
jgi:outer membrane biosynthesis protein TonB